MAKDEKQNSEANESYITHKDHSGSTFFQSTQGFVVTTEIEPVKEILKKSKSSKNND